MGAKRIVFAASASELPSSNLGTFDVIMVVLLLVLVGVSVYYIATTQKTIYRVQEGFKAKSRKNKKMAKEGFKAQKYGVVYIYMSGCPYCVRFDKTHDDVSKDAQMIKTFVFEEKIDIKSAAADKYKQYKCDGFPCYMIFDKESDKLVGQGTGYRSPDEWKAWLNSSI